MRFWRRYRPARAVKPSNPIHPRPEDRCVPSTVCREAEVLLPSVRSGWTAGPGEKNSAVRVGFEATRLG
jgi:hypothetical protein